MASPSTRAAPSSLDVASRSRQKSDAKTHLLSTWLALRLGVPVDLTWSRGRRTLFSYHRHQGRLLLRLNRVFCAVGELELEALAAALKGANRAAMKTLRVFFERHALFEQSPARALPLRTKGRVYDLKELFDEQNHTYFSGKSQASITWGRASTRKPKSPRRSMQLGCYVPELKLIRIHPRLDDEDVPRFFVSHVVYHELLHEVFGLGDANTHRRIHPPEFVLVEQGHPDYGRSIAWESQNLRRLLAR